MRSAANKAKSIDEKVKSMVNIAVEAVQAQTDNNTFEIRTALEDWGTLNLAVKKRVAACFPIVCAERKIAIEIVAIHRGYRQYRRI